jgi:hypothetical protein
MNKTFLSLLSVGLLVGSVAINPQTVMAAGGVALSAGQVVAVKKVRCGWIKNKWVAGSVLRNALFYSGTQQVTDLNKKAKNKKLSSSARSKLLAKAKSLKLKFANDQKVCRKLLPFQGSGPNPVPVPTVLPTPRPDATTVAWDAKAVSVQTNLGSEYTYFCPPTGANLPAIYGSDSYTTDSSICAAAVHVGIITKASGGNVKFRIKGSQSQFFGSLRNGVQSSFYGSFAYSYSFVTFESGAEYLNPGPLPISSTQDASPLYTYVGQQYSFACPANGSLDSIWGTDVYTYDSSICSAAVHSGRASLASGGVVTIQIAPGQTSYTGSTRFGVTSSSYGSWGGSFFIVP